MNLHKFFIGRAIGFLVLLGVVGLIALFYLFNNYIYQEKQGDDTRVTEPYRATLSGEYVCLPHKDTQGPQTDECAAGLKTDAGEYFGIDLYTMSQEHRPLSVGERISANGVVTPIEYLSSNQWQRYPIQGIFSVTDSLQVLE